jgi:hypothetical protein
MPDTEDYQIGTSSGSMIKLALVTTSGSSTPIPYPKSSFQPYADEQVLVSGLVRGVGFPIAVWTWGVITRTERDALRQYCPGKSANVWIRTKTMDSADSNANYSAVLVWPTQEEERDTQRRLNLKITFKTLVAV